jgi:hypothetical protein
VIALGAFETTWELLKMPYHITESENLDSIMRDGLKPTGDLPHQNLPEAMMLQEEQFDDYDETAFLDQMKQHASRLFGDDNPNRLFEGKWSWALPHDLHELAGYGVGMKQPVLLRVQGDYIPDYGQEDFTQMRTPHTIPPQDIEVAQRFPARTNQTDYDWRRMLENILMDI